MKKILTFTILALIITACDTWGVPPQPFPVWTATSSGTPGIVTATPIILLPVTQTIIPGVTVITPFTPTIQETPSSTATFAPIPPTATATFPPIQAVAVDILGCNTSIDITHGMGEVTNAYITVKNTGTVDLPNMCALLRAIDEDREHPDKRVCVSNLPAQNQINLKLTVDSVYKKDTVIQVDITSSEVILLRVDKPSCTDIGLFGGTPSDVGVIKPIQP